MKKHFKLFIFIVFTFFFLQNYKLLAKQNEITLNLDAVSYEQPIVKVKVNYSSPETDYLTLLNDNNNEFLLYFVIPTGTIPMDKIFLKLQVKKLRVFKRLLPSLIPGHKTI